MFRKGRFTLSDTLRGAALRMTYPKIYCNQKIDMLIQISIKKQSRHFLPGNILAIFYFLEVNLGDGEIG
jgi:hypothetical protein